MGASMVPMTVSRTECKKVEMSVALQALMLVAKTVVSKDFLQVDRLAGLMAIQMAELSVRNWAAEKDLMKAETMVRWTAY